MRGWHMLLTVGLSLTPALFAEADEHDKEARAQFERGVELYDDGKYD